MAFIDEVTIYAEAGRGGHGVVRWRHEKGVEMGGPSGGNGGAGGNVYARVVRDLAVLARYKQTKDFYAERGADGAKQSKQGKTGKDIFIDFPVGTVLTNLSSGDVYDLEKEGEEILILKGGKGGLGNEHFKASTNVRPKEWTPGKDGEKAHFKAELHLIADIGLVGLPNAGKSSILNALTNARAKVAGYEFTTLEPNLGNMYGFILADIPGLIEGASEGRGLGHRFLKHVRRTRMLLHCISLENEDVAAVYKVIRDELKKFDPVLAKKPEVILLTKTDIVTPEELRKKTAELKKTKKKVLTVSIIDDAAVKELGDTLVKLLKE